MSHNVRDVGRVPVVKRLLPKEVADFLSASFEEIKEIGLSVENYTFSDLFIINALLATAACWGRADLISAANISDEFSDSLEMALESQGVQFL